MTLRGHEDIAFTVYLDAVLYKWVDSRVFQTFTLERISRTLLDFDSNAHFIAAAIQTSELNLVGHIKPTACKLVDFQHFLSFL